jgi:hypothetical protein
VEKLKKDIYDANKTIKIVGHMLFVTYPLVKDNKMFIGMLESINKSLILAMNSILYYERMYKRINPYPDDFDTKIEILRKIKGRRYEFDKDVCNLILEISDLVKYRKHAPIEFSRKDAFILCDKYYKTVIIKENDMKNYFSKAKVFILQVNNIILEEKKIDEFNR